MGRQPRLDGLHRGVLEVRCDMENWKAIRQDVLVHGLSQRAACEKYQLGWHTLKKILADAEPPGYRQRQVRPKRVLAPVLPIIHEILEADRNAPKKQRHTAKRIFERLKAEYGYLGGKTVAPAAVDPAAVAPTAVSLAAADDLAAAEGVPASRMRMLPLPGIEGRLGHALLRAERTHTQLARQPRPRRSLHSRARSESPRPLDMTISLMEPHQGYPTPQEATSPYGHGCSPLLVAHCQRTARSRGGPSPGRTPTA